jgi:hypothetical protein
MVIIIYQCKQSITVTVHIDQLINQLLGPMPQVSTWTNHSNTLFPFEKDR